MRSWAAAVQVGDCQQSPTCSHNVLITSILLCTLFFYLKWCCRCYLRVLAAKRGYFFMLSGRHLTKSLEADHSTVFLVWQAKVFILHKMKQQQHVIPHSFFFFPFKMFSIFLVQQFHILFVSLNRVSAFPLHKSQSELLQCLPASFWDQY